MPTHRCTMTRTAPRSARFRSNLTSAVPGDPRHRRAAAGARRGHRAAPAGHAAAHPAAHLCPGAGRLDPSFAAVAPAAIDLLHEHGVRLVASTRHRSTRRRARRSTATSGCARTAWRCSRAAARRGAARRLRADRTAAEVARRRRQPGAGGAARALTVMRLPAPTASSWTCAIRWPRIGRPSRCPTASSTSTATRSAPCRRPPRRGCASGRERVGPRADRLVERRRLGRRTAPGRRPDRPADRRRGRRGDLRRLDLGQPVQGARRGAAAAAHERRRLRRDPVRARQLPDRPVHRAGDHRGVRRPLPPADGARRGDRYHVDEGTAVLLLTTSTIAAAACTIWPT